MFYSKVVLEQEIRQISQKKYLTREPSCDSGGNEFSVAKYKNFKKQYTNVNMTFFTIRKTSEHFLANKSNAMSIYFFTAAELLLFFISFANLGLWWEYNSFISSYIFVRQS